MKKRRASNYPVQSGKGVELKPFSAQTCQNCGYPFEGNFCPSCGQSVKEFHKPIRHFAEDLFGSVFSLDVRLLRTLPVLLFHPGKLPAEYIGGKRVTYMAPFKLYFFVSVIFFFLIGWQTKNALNQASSGENVASAEDSVMTSQLNGPVNLQNDTVIRIHNLKDGNGLALSLSKRLQAQLIDSTMTPRERAKISRKLHTLENPDLLISRIYQFTSWSLFLLMPLFALILYIFFHKKRRFYAEHLIYSVNLHTFFFLVAIITVVIGFLFGGILNKYGSLILLFTLIYSIVGIRNFYRTRWISAIFSNLGIFFLYLIIILAVLAGGAILAFKV